MTTLALVNPSTLLGKELQEILEKNVAFNKNLQLFTTDADEGSLLTDVGGEATLVRPLEAEALADVDLVFICGDGDAVGAALALTPETCPAIVLSEDAGAVPGPARVAGRPGPAGHRLVSAHPAVVALCRLLDLLRPFSPQDAVTTVILPASTRGKDGMDELFEQTRSILAFEGDKPEDVFGHQLAFNIVPAGCRDELETQLAAVLGDGSPAVALEALQGGIFHGLSVSLSVRLEKEPSPQEVDEALAGAASAETAPDPGHLGPIDAAAAPHILLAPVRRSAARYSIWAVMDNLSYGGALNALELAEEILGKPAA